MSWFLIAMGGVYVIIMIIFLFVLLLFSFIIRDVLQALGRRMLAVPRRALSCTQGLVRICAFILIHYPGSGRCFLFEPSHFLTGRSRIKNKLVVRLSVFLL